MKRATIIVSTAACVGAAAMALAATSTPPPLGGYAILGIDLVKVGVSARITSGAVGATLGGVQVAAHARVSGVIAADTVRLGLSSKVGRLFCHFVTGPFRQRRVVGGPVVGGSPPPVCRSFTTPLVDPNLLPAVQVSPGASDLRIPRHTATSPLPGGSFNRVIVGPSALLDLAGGDYIFRSLRVGSNGRLVCTGTCHIGILEDVRVAPRGQLGAASTLQVDQARIDVGSNTTTRAFVARRGAIVAATIYAPTGNIVLGPGGRYSGAYVGRTVKVGPNARVRGDSAL